MAVLAAALIAGTYLSAPLAAHAQAPNGPLQIQQLSPRLSRIWGDAGGGVLVLHGADGTLLVDTQSLGVARELDSLIAVVTKSPVRLIVNTHYHGDHVDGNVRWQERGATAIAHRNVRVQAAKDTTIKDWGDWHREPLPAAGMPKLAVDDSLTLHVAGETVTLLHAPHAHTDGDLMVWFRESDAIMVGDIVEIDAAPFIDLWAGGSIDGMIATCDRVLKLAGPKTRIVPGHGPVVDRARLQSYRDVLVDVRGSVQKALDVGTPAKQVLESKPAARHAAVLGGERAAHHFASLVVHELSRRRTAATR